MAAAQNNLTTEQINDPRVRQLLEATEPLSIRLAASFWATAGWTPDMPHYNGKFNPKGWICKKRGELRVLFDEESGGTTYKTTITTMLQHGLTIVEPTQRFYDDSSAPSSPDENVLVSQLGGGRAAAATARARMSQLSPVSGRGSSLGSPNSIGRGGDTDSSTNSSPFGEQRTRRSSRSNSSSPSPSPSPAARSPTAAGGAPADRERDSSDEEQEALEEERTAFGTKFTKTTKDRHQPVQALTWTLVDSKPLKDDIRKQAPGVHGTEFCAQLLNLNGVAQQDLEPYSAFKHMTPQDWIPRMAARANEHLHDVPADQNYRKTTSGELECILGLAGACAVNGSGPFSSMFSHAPFDASGFFPGPCFGRFGVSKNRALIVLRAAHLSHGPMQPAGEGPHWFINKPLSEFREHMASTFKASWLRCMDESGPPWHGGEGEGDFNFNPHNMYIPRKPEPVCAEFNTAGCSFSRVVDTIEYEMAAKYHGNTKYVGTHTGSYNAALAMRMAEVGNGTNGLVYGDARFGGVKSAYWNMKEFGVHSAWDVKTMTALFPKAELVRLTPKEHGAFIVMQAEISEGFPPGKKVTLYGIGQRRGPKVHTFLTTCGSFDLEIPARFNRTANMDAAPWLTPSILNTITKAQPMIDVFNRTVFDQLGFHDSFVTRCFETRFVQHFLLPFCYVNAINAAKYFNRKVYGEANNKAMLLELFSKMVRNPEWAAALSAPPDGPGGGGALSTRAGTSYGGVRGHARVSIRGGPPSRESPCKHVLIPLKDIPGYKGAKQQRCFECNELCSWACARCSDKDNFVALHPPVTQGSKRKYGCLAAHRRNPTGDGYAGFHESISGTSKVCKRRRKINLVNLD